MVALALIPGLHAAVAKIVWRFPFPETTTLLGFVAAANVNSVAPLLHPGASIALIAALSFAFYSHKGYLNGAKSRQVLLSTWNSAAPTSLSIFSMVGLSTLMDATGMTLTLAQALSHWIGLAYPLISPLIGILGAFATGSNNNSNVLFTSLQLNAALLLSLEPRWLVAAQTAGGALGSMIAPAKIVVGCSTVGIKDQHGEVMRLTLPFSLFIGLLLGLAAWIFLSLL
jgi:lactate permease